MSAPDQAAPDDQPLYYLNNFRRALAWISTRSSNILDTHEIAFIRSFDALPLAAAALFVRMAMRKGPLFRTSALRYTEIGCPLTAAQPLIELGWLKANPLISLEQLFAMHTLPELTRRFANTTQMGRKGMRKQEWCLALQDAFDARQPHSEWMPDDEDTLFELAAAPMCTRLRLLFFGNLHQQWSEFVLSDLGIFRYESIPLAPESRAFRHREDVDNYLALHECRQALDTDAPSQALIEQALKVKTDNVWVSDRQAKLLFRIGQRCEKARAWDDALLAYQHSTYFGARHRCMRVLERSGQPERALALAEQALTTPESEAEGQRLARMMPRLLRVTGRSRATSTTQAVIGQQVLSLAFPEVPTRVEYAVRNHLHRDDAPVVYVENALVNALFGLLCWKAIFAPLPGAFFHPFQRAPADLNAPDFALRRHAQFASCLAQLNDGRYADTIRACYQEKQGVQSPFVSWGLLTPELIELALACMSAQHLQHLFVRLMTDVRANRHGLPDLIRFVPAEARFEFIEVKGPGDRLQDNQTRWLQYCVMHGMTATVCHVHWHDAATVTAAC